jgi:hypothetical protein
VIQKIFIFISLNFIFSAAAWANSDQNLGIDEAEIEHEIHLLEQRKIDFKKQLQAAELDQPASLRALQKERIEHDKVAEKARQQYVREQSRVIEPDAEEREKIESRLQEKFDELNERKTRAYNKLRERRDQRISAAHVQINENLEYDIRVPEKANRAKSKTSKPKAWMKTESF